MSIVTYSGKTVKYGTKWVDGGLPSVGEDWIRFKFDEIGYDPSVDVPTSSSTDIAEWVQQSVNPNIWDCRAGRNGAHRFVGNFNLITTSQPYDVLEAKLSWIWELSCFNHCTYLRSAKNLYFPNATDLGQLFSSCTSLADVSITTSSALLITVAMFAGCSSLVTAPMFDTSGVQNMQSMFWCATSLKNIPLYDTGNVTSMYSMFSGSGIEYCPHFDTSSVENFRDAFSLCESLLECPYYLSTASATNVTQMFDICNHMQSGLLAMYQQMSTQETPPAEHTYCFRMCTPAAEMAQIPSDWK